MGGVGRLDGGGGAAKGGGRGGGEEATAARKAEKEARVGAARMALDRGLILCDKGDVARGLVALTDALAAAVEADDADLESAIRYELAAWQRQTWRLRAVLPGP